MAKREIETSTDSREIISLARKVAGKYGDTGEQWQTHFMLGWLAEEIARRNRENLR